ncbi:MAG TPA: thiamine phosphate synthase [Polyangiaceae bacterium]|nr:thiamine phosphate synthase [Polyangiaceae bacterium]
MGLAPRLLVFTDLSLAPEAVWRERVSRLAKLARPKALLVVLRDKERSARERIELGAALGEMLRECGQYIGVAERMDLALLLRADALHLGESSVETSEARRLVGPLFISRACHDPLRISEGDADAIVLSPILEARKRKPALGTESLTLARARLPEKMLFALGGVRAENAAACLRAGADGVAVIGAALHDDPGELVRALGIARG